MRNNLDLRIYTPLSHLRSLALVARRLSFLPLQPARSVLSGRNSSRLRGRGLSFEELRDYLPGDDIRTIDWKVTARTGKPHVRVFTEERDRPSMLMVDQRMSMFFGSVLNMKSVTAAEAASVSAQRILAQGDRVGGIIFDDKDVIELPPKRSQASLDRFLKTLSQKNLALNSDREKIAEPLHLNRPLEALSKIVTHNHLVMIFSDFDQVNDSTTELLRTISSHNDLILCLVIDPLGKKLPENVNLAVTDGELQFDLDSNDTKAFQSVARAMKERIEHVLQWEKNLNLSVLPVMTSEQTVPQLIRLLNEGVGAEVT